MLYHYVTLYSLKHHAKRKKNCLTFCSEKSCHGSVAQTRIHSFVERRACVTFAWCVLQTPLHMQSIRHPLDTEYDGPDAAINNPKCGDHEGQGLHNVTFCTFVVTATRPRGLSRGSAAALLLALPVRITQEARMSVSSECCVSCRGPRDEPIPRPEQPYRVCICHWMRSRATRQRSRLKDEWKISFILAQPE